MRTERQEQKSQVKACPYWARYAEGQDGWVVAHCSYNACQKEKKQGRVWEGPLKEPRCFVGFAREVAKFSPAIILYNSLWQSVAAVDAPPQMTEDDWNKVVEVFRSCINSYGDDLAAVSVLDVKDRLAPILERLF